MSPDRKPGEFVVTVRVYKEKPETKDECPNIQLSSRAQPGEDSSFDPYTNCQIKAVRSALRDLGYWIENDMQSEIKLAEESIAKSNENRQADAGSNDATINGSGAVSSPNLGTVFFPSKDEEHNVENHAEQSEKEEVKSGSAKSSKTTDYSKKDVVEKSDTLEDSASDVTEEEAPEKDTVVDKRDSDNSLVDSEVDNEKSEKKKSKGKTIKSDIEIDSDLEAARNTEVTYKTYQGTTIGELVDSGSKRDMRLVEWFAKSSVAEEKFAKEAKAARIVLGL